MYQIKRSRIVEELEIDDGGNKVVLKVDINPDRILGEYNRAQYAIAQAQLAAKKAKDDKDVQASEEALGSAILSLMQIVFGREQLDQILQIYDNHPLEMLGDIAPFISDVVAPKIQEAQQRIQERYRQVGRRGK